MIVDFSWKVTVGKEVCLGFHKVIRISDSHIIHCIYLVVSETFEYIDKASRLGMEGIVVAG